jgi:hypothetical protein
MLHVFGFHKVGVALGDLYFVDPEPDRGQEGPEHGVRLEVRLLEMPPESGSIYAARPILVDRPIWRADLFESVDGRAGSHDRTHHHPQMRGWEPGKRQFDRAMTADPIAFVGERLSDLEGLLRGAGMDPSAVDERDASELRGALPQILATVRSLLDGVARGELARPPDGEPLAAARVGWL